MVIDTVRDGEVLLGTVAIEPNRWGTIRADRSPSVDLAAWFERIAALPIEGIELWEGHLPSLERAAAADAPPVRVLSSYVSFDDPDPGARRAVAADARRCGAPAVKFNVGSDVGAEAAYADRLAAWVDDLGERVTAICECHAGTIADDPSVAARILDVGGPPARLQALVHTHDDADLIAAEFEAFGERITHVHVNHLDPATLQHPPLGEVQDALGRTVDHLRTLGFHGSWTLEFVNGLLTDRDRPGALLDQAGDDLAVLRPLVDAR